ncbi:MAG: hypothetical protein AMJ79_00325 [Phycisphaerae bacterium SM23_30]|nr:MAG: hypothetical protein AMJ79_00325 [Phycisphaerae bacterium SM23_30]
MPQKKYVLITAARNEEKYIEETLKSVTAQTILPQHWVIVSDGSVDRTEEIVSAYKEKCSFINLICLDSKRERDFAAKVSAIEIGYKSIASYGFDFIGILDADISVEPSYYEQILQEFERNPKLGVAGGEAYNLIGNKFARVTSVLHHVPGPVQMFQRACFDAVGGFPPLRFGGEDTAAEVMVRMKGWVTESFRGIPVYHHRQTGTATGGILQARFREGRMDYYLGYHPLFAVAKALARLLRKPYLIGSLVSMIAYILEWLRGGKIQLPDDYISFLHKEQMQRIKLLLRLARKKITRPS